MIFANVTGVFSRKIKLLFNLKKERLILQKFQINNPENNA